MLGAEAKRTIAAVVVGLVVGLGGVAGQPAAQARRDDNGAAPDRGGDLYGCDRTIGRQPEGHLTKRTTPPAEAAVRPGDTVDVDLVWVRGDWSASRLHKVLDCVAIDGRLVRSLQGGESPTDNDGRFRRSYTVPADVPAGARICDQAMLSGPSPRGDYDRQISTMVCHTVAGPGAADRAPCTDRCGARPCGGCTQPPSGGDRGGSGRGCPDCYQRPPSNAGGGEGRGCADCHERPPSNAGGGEGRGCSDCYERPPSNAGGGDARGCSDCSDSPPARDRCGDERRCDDGRDGCGAGSGAHDRRHCGDRDSGDCRCDDRDHDGSFLHRLLRHLFAGHGD
jgi:hypothetical protein